MKIKCLIVCSLIFVLGTLTVYAQNTQYKKRGIASFYADKFEGRTTANGEIYYHVKRTAAHRTLPFGTVVKVTNLENNKHVIVRINDRGPFIDNRIIDLSKSAARILGFVNAGLAKVEVEVIANTNDLPDKKKPNKQSTGIYYQINTTTAKPVGKGIQVASYTNDENLLQLIAEIKQEYNEKVFVELAQIKNQKLYRVIVGSTTNSKELDNLKRKLQKKYPDCFIVKFK